MQVVEGLYVRGWVSERAEFRKYAQNAHTVDQLAACLLAISNALRPLVRLLYCIVLYCILLYCILLYHKDDFVCF